MKKYIFFIIILIAFSDCSTVFAAPRFNFLSRNYNPRPVTGTIQAIKRNTIEIFDEDYRERREFVYVGDKSGFHPGERVRIYYHLPGNIADIVKKMTPVEYQQGTQNAGYILKSK